MNKREKQAAFKTALLTARTTITEQLAAIAVETDEYLLRIARFEVLAGINLSHIRETFASAKAAKVTLTKAAGIGTDDWRIFAGESVPGKDVKTIYRWTNAGTVARHLDDLLPATALIGSLAPLYRILTAATKAADPEGTAAVDLLRETYRECLAAAGTKDGVQVAPTETETKAAAERVCPSNRSGGAKAEPTETDDDDTDDDDGAETRRESSDGLLVLDPVAVESCSGNWTPVLRQLTETHGVTETAVSAIGLAVLRFAGEHGQGTMAAVLTMAASAAVQVTDVPSLAAAVLDVPAEPETKTAA